MFYLFFCLQSELIQLYVMIFTYNVDNDYKNVNPSLQRFFIRLRSYLKANLALTCEKLR
jgi:hypothetical protein